MLIRLNVSHFHSLQIQGISLADNSPHRDYSLNVIIKSNSIIMTNCKAETSIHEAYAKYQGEHHFFSSSC